MNNIFCCLSCGRYVISEEKDLHECKPLRDFEVVDDTLRVFDGFVWYPLKLDQVRPTSFDMKKFRQRLDRTLEQYFYKVLVPYHTVW